MALQGVGLTPIRSVYDQIMRTDRKLTEKTGITQNVTPVFLSSILQ